eukprot:221220-Rhodomonas_salina.1
MECRRILPLQGGFERAWGRFSNSCHGWHHTRSRLCASNLRARERSSRAAPSDAALERIGHVEHL